MSMKFAIPIIAAFAMTSAGAIAQSGNAAAAGRSGAAAGAVEAGSSKHDRANKRDRRGDRATRPANSASTYGSGAVHTRRDSASAAVTSGGRASGTGPQSTATTVDAYGETTRDGSSADIYGDSVANSGAQR